MKFSHAAPKSVFHHPLSQFLAELGEGLVTLTDAFFRFKLRNALLKFTPVDNWSPEFLQWLRIRGGPKSQRLEIPHAVHVDLLPLDCLAAKAQYVLFANDL